MKTARAKYEILTPISQTFIPRQVAPGVTESTYGYGYFELKQLERIARVCYKSEAAMDGAESAEKLIRKLIKNGHEAMLEHGYLSVWFQCDRAVSHELVRHRMASFAQESQRYCNYSKDKFGGEITVIQPDWMDDEDDLGYSTWVKSCKEDEKAYFKLLEDGYLPEQARMVLPNCTKTEIVVTANYREWRHILKLRTAKNAHRDMRYLMGQLLKELKEKLPVIFEDI